MTLEHNTAIQIFPIIESDIRFNHLGTETRTKSFSLTQTELFFQLEPK
jgi:hypothetical protein